MSSKFEAFSSGGFKLRGTDARTEYLLPQYMRHPGVISCDRCMRMCGTNYKYLSNRVVRGDPLLTNRMIFHWSRPMCTAMPEDVGQGCDYNAGLCRGAMLVSLRCLGLPTPLSSSLLTKIEWKEERMSGALVPLALQWSLNETADSFYKISKDVVRAASTDNVQPTVLDALAKFGTTLAICPETEYRVEQGLRQSRGSRAIEFLKARIGFMAGDSCEVLSESTGGIRFLSLAAALVTCESLEAAKATREMLRASARSDQFLPTLGQLRDVYEALGYKLHRLGFGDEVLKRHGPLMEGEIEKAQQSLQEEMQRALR